MKKGTSDAMKILIIEDELDLCFALNKTLTKEGYEITIANSGEKALEFLELNQYELVLLDLNVPVLDGMSILNKLREKDQITKVLIMSAISSIESKVTGFDYGANDYIVKPFDIDELKARIRNLIRMRFITEKNVVEFCGFSIDLNSRQCYFKETKIELTKKEFNILSYLVKNSSRIVSQEELIEYLWKDEDDLFSNAIRVHISSIRKKMYQFCEEDIIETIKGCGYRVGGRL